MTSKFRPLLARALAIFGLAALLSTPLSAQLDPRLQKGKTDFLDLYQQTNTETLKPEIVTIFDFSGSMDSIMYHPMYPNNDLGDNDGSALMKFSLTQSSSGAYVCTATLSFGGWTTFTASSDSSTNPLIRPDGSVLTATDIDKNYVSTGLPGESASPKSSDVRNWIRSMSHVRFTYNGRTLDIPVLWTILDDASVTPGPDEFRTQKMGWPLKMTILDPNSGKNYEMDTLYRIPGNSLMDSTSPAGLANMTLGKGPGGTGSYNSGTAVYNMYRISYFKWLFSSASAPYIPDATAAGGAGAAFKNGIPARSRVQAVKDAAERTWAKHYNQVIWAYRFLNSYASNGDVEYNHNSMYNDSRNVIPPDPRTSLQYGGAQRGWYLLNKDSLTGLTRLSAYQAWNGTPMTHAIGNTLAQLNDPNSIFNDVETTANNLKPVDCMKHFVMLFTDGVPSNYGGDANTKTPYLNGTTFDANTGNAGIMSSPSDMNPNGNYFNPINMAAVAAHLGDNNLANHMNVPTYPGAGTYSSSGGTSVQNWLPFYVKSRGAGSDFTTFTKPHPIYTMTVGISLAGSVTDSQSPKQRLFLAAAFGDPTRTHVDDITTLKPFQLTNPLDPTSKDPNSVYFFDGASPQTLVDNLDQAFTSAIALSGQNAAATPTVPFVGLGLASEIYLGDFTIPSNGGPVWPGDLLMFPTQQVSGQTVILDNTGAAATTLTPAKAMWSASAALAARPWYQRKVFTRVPATATTPNPPLVPFAFNPPSGYPSTFVASSTGFDAIKSYVATGMTTDAAKNNLIEFVLGADTTSSASLLPNRSTIMGDVIDSAPAAVEYTLTPAIISGLPATLASAAGNPGARFRVIFVGTNQGMLHAFGEISWPDSTVDPTKPPLTRGVVDELWAFVPTDLLAHLDYLEGINPHRFLVDGSPYVYFLDLPPTGSMLGNGTVDSTETARVVFGLRKGGRSYYALDIHDPFNPTMSWALSPDETTADPTILDGRIEASNTAMAKTVVEDMGFSSSALAVGRVAYGSPVTHLRDALFLGGGLSTPDIDAQFPDSSGNPTPLGRSALAVDIANGNILMAWDFLHDSTMSATAAGMGPVGAGVVPFEYFLNSGLAQRAYFTDYNGSLWALGSGKTTVASDGFNYRRDTSNLDAWTQDGNVGSAPYLRKIYAGAANDYVSTLPAPFLTGNVPITAGAIPVGIAMSSGDRNNPLDYNYTSTTKPAGHEVTVVFDNQRADLGGTPIQPTDLYNVPNTPATSTTPVDVIPGNAKFYLAVGKRGYDIPFPAPSGGYIPKGVNEPLVLGGAMFFSYFTPTSSDPCTGGSGTTNSNRVCDVLYPVYQGNTVTVTNSYNGPCQGGNVFAWSGVATNFSARSTVSVNQAGLVSTGGTGAPGGNQTQVQTIFGQVKDRVPRPRTWRTVR